MKRILLVLVLLLAPSLAWGQCSGVFPNNTICGNATGGSNTPRATSSISFPANLTIGTSTITGGTNTYLLYNNAGVVGNEQFVPLANGGLGGSQAAAVANSVPVFPGSGGAAAPTSATTWFDTICGSSIGRSWVRLTGGWGCLWSGYADPKWWGAAGDATGNDAAAFQSAQDALEAVGIGELKPSCGVYRITATINIAVPIQWNLRNCVQLISSSNIAFLTVTGTSGFYNWVLRGASFASDNAGTRTSVRAIKFNIPPGAVVAYPNISSVYILGMYYGFEINSTTGSNEAGFDYGSFDQIVSQGYGANSTVDLFHFTNGSGTGNQFSNIRGNVSGHCFNYTGGGGALGSGQNVGDLNFSNIFCVGGVGSKAFKFANSAKYRNKISINGGQCDAGCTTGIEIDSYAGLKVVGFSNGGFASHNITNATLSGIYDGETLGVSVAPVAAAYKSQFYGDATCTLGIGGPVASGAGTTSVNFGNEAGTVQCAGEYRATSHGFTAGDIDVSDTTEATTLGAGSINTLGGVYAAKKVIGSQVQSTVATGTAPLVVASTTNVTNLNASSLNGATFAAPGAIGGGTPSSGAFTTISASGQITSTVATGTAPLVVASTTQVANLNAATAGTATTATNATNSAITDDTTTAAVMYPVWVTTNTGNLPLKVSSTKFTFTPSTGNVSMAGHLLLNGASGGTAQIIELLVPAASGLSMDFTQAGASAFTIGYENGTGLGTLALLRTITTDPIVFMTNGNNTRFTIASDGGITTGAAASQGAGTINAAGAYYSNGTIGVTCGAGLGASSRTTLGLVTTC